MTKAFVSMVKATSRLELLLHFITFWCYVFEYAGTYRFQREVATLTRQTDNF